MASPTPEAIRLLQTRIWEGTISLDIRLSATDCTTYDQSNPYLVTVPRLSYLPQLLPRLHSFFSPSLVNPDIGCHEAWLSCDDVPMKWHYPIGLLYDLFSGVEHAGLDSKSNQQDTATNRVEEASIKPWKLLLHYKNYPTELIFPLDPDGRVIQDAFINSVKEADFTRTGTAKTVMSLSKNDSDALWKAVQAHDMTLYNTVYMEILISPSIKLRNIPTKIYLPMTASSSTVPDTSQAREHEKSDQEPRRGTIRTIQGLVPPIINNQASTVGIALNKLIPAVFPSKRSTRVAVPVLHGAVIPMDADLEALGRACSYADGFLHIVIVLLSLS